MSPEVKAFFDNATNTVSFIVKDPESNSIAIVDSVLDFDFASGHTDTASADEVIAYVRKNKLKVEWILESHVHADHLSAAPYIQEQLGGKIGIGANIITVQDVFGKIFNEGSEFQRDRKSTRLNSSHVVISYAVFCWKKKKNEKRSLK